MPKRNWKRSLGKAKNLRASIERRTDMGVFPLLKLPGELRNLVIEQTLPKSCKQGARLPVEEDSVFENEMGEMARTCKQLCGEIMSYVVRRPFVCEVKVDVNDNYWDGSLYNDTAEFGKWHTKYRDPLFDWEGPIQDHITRVDLRLVVPDNIFFKDVEKSYEQNCKDIAKSILLRLAILPNLQALRLHVTTHCSWFGSQKNRPTATGHPNGEELAKMIGSNILRGIVRQLARDITVSPVACLRGKVDTSKWPLDPCPFCRLRHSSSTPAFHKKELSALIEELKFEQGADLDSSEHAEDDGAVSQLIALPVFRGMMID